MLSILTYKKAKATILNPIRNEVIKKQSTILTEILNEISENENSIDQALDYVGVVYVNVFMILTEYGFIFRGHEKIEGEIDKVVDGWTYIGKNNVIEDVKIMDIYPENENKELKVNLGRHKFENLKKGIVHIDRIYLTKKHRGFFKKLSEYADNPFLPKNIQLILLNIIKDVKTNLAVNLKTILEQFLLEFSEKYFINNENPEFTPLGVYNKFNHNRIHHKKEFQMLKSEVRDYLKIDDKWP